MSATADDATDGYVTDVDYVHGFHAGLAPMNLAFAALMGGVRPPEVDRPFAYLDLGCGNGFTPALLAAANPHAEFWGADFNPAHIRNATATAEAAGLSNAMFLEASFADLLDTELPLFDFVVVHGIWSWVGPVQRDRIVELLGRFLKPGGLVLISYNCHPGWDPLLSLRRLMVDAGGPRGTSVERVERGLATARRLREAGAGYFRGNPAACGALEAMERAGPAYLAHEYLNRYWSVFYPGEVWDVVAPAGLAYAGQARVADAFDELSLTADQRALVDEQPDPTAAQGLRDLILNRRIRYDLFVRDGAHTGRHDKAAWIADRRFVLAKPRAEWEPVEHTPGGELVMPMAICAPLLDGLERGAATGEVLAAQPALAAVSRQDMDDALCILVATGQVQPALGAAGEAARRVATERFNAAALASARAGEPAAALASPVTGSGVAVAPGEQLLLDALRHGVPLEAIGADAGHLMNTLRMLGIA